jgi:hypothetical protein
MEKEGSGGASGGELSPEFAMFQVRFRLLPFSHPRSPSLFPVNTSLLVSGVITGS